MICSRAWREIYISEKREVAPCRWYLGEKLDLLDYLKSNDLVTNQKIFKNLRINQLKTDYPASCSHCYFCKSDAPTTFEADPIIYRETGADGRILKKVKNLFLEFKNNKAPPPLDYFIQVNFVEDYSISAFIDSIEDERNFIGWVDSSTSRHSIYQKELVVFSTSDEVGGLIEEKFEKVKFSTKIFSGSDLFRDLMKNNLTSVKERDLDRFTELLIQSKEIEKLISFLRNSDMSKISLRVLKNAAELLKNNKLHKDLRRVILTILARTHSLDFDMLNLLGDLKDLGFADDAFEFISKNKKDFDEGYFNDVLFTPGWNNLSEVNHLLLVDLYDKESINTPLFKESKALLLKKANRVEESYILHLELLAESSKGTVLESFFSGGWEKVPAETYFKGEEIFSEHLENEKAYLQYLRLIKRKGSPEDYLKGLLSFNTRFDNQEVKRELFAGEWKHLNESALKELVHYFTLNLEIIKKNKEYATNAAKYFKLQGRHNEAFECLWEANSSAEISVDEGFLNGSWLDLNDENLEKLQAYLEGQKFEGINRKKAFLNIQLINIASGKLVDKSMIYLDELEKQVLEDDFYTWYLKQKLFLMMNNIDRAIEAHIRMMQFRESSTYEDYMQLAGLYKMNSSIVLSNKALEKAVEIKPDSIDDLKVIAWNYKKMKNYAKSVEVFKKVLELSPNDADSQNEIRRMSGSVIKKAKLVINRLFNYE